MLSNDMVKITGTGELKSQPASVSGSGHAAVSLIRELVVSFEPSLADDLDHIIVQLRGQDEPYLRAIVSHPEGTCEGIGIQYGKLEPETITAIAKGELDDRQRDSDRRSKWWMIVGAAVLSVVGTLFVVGMNGG